MRTLTTTSLAIALTLGAAGSLQAQTRSARPLPDPVVPSRAFREAVARGTRTDSGVPGPGYWQQWTRYELTARLEPEEKRLSGRARIVYHNRAPYTLRTLLLHLFQNVHADGAVRNRAMEVTGGVRLERVVAGGEALEEIRGRDDRPGYAVGGTVLAIALPEELASNDSAEIEIDWSFRIPQQGIGGRMGWSEDNLFHIAYWYPQMAVFDDVVAWHTDQFLGNSEFYVGFGDYELTIEAPEGWVVMGTGELQNPEEVLTPAVLERYRRAATSDEAVHVLTESDLGPGKATRRSPEGYLRWRFVADSVRDVAFSAVRESRWDAARTKVGDRDGDGDEDYALVNAFWRGEAELWSEQWRYAQHSIDFLSRWMGFAYPWPHMTSVEGAGIIGGGMEFPMMTLIGRGRPDASSDTALYGVTAHELAHMWFPMIVGTDEARRAWMDEGTTSFNSGHASTDFFPGRDAGGNRERYLAVARAELEGELMRWSNYHYPGPAYGVASYSKPATLLNTLRALLGPTRFDPIYHAYVRAWAYRHPKPWDFFNFFAARSGEDLEWFWRTWYYETWTLDQAVADVAAGPDGTVITIEDRGRAPMPARVLITLEDGDTLRREVPVETWLSGETIAVVSVPPGSSVVRVVIDPEEAFPDVDRRNNVWEETSVGGGA